MIQRQTIKKMSEPCFSYNTSNPSGEVPLSDLSHPQFSSSPEEQARVSACATPAEDIACTNAISRVPERKMIIQLISDHMTQWQSDNVIVVHY